MSKLNGIISTEDQVLIHTVFSQLHTNNTKDIIETIETVVHKHPNYFSTRTRRQKIDAYTLTATILDTLLDKEINPLAARLTAEAFSAFNNNKIDEQECDMWDAHNQCCMNSRVEMIFPELLGCEKRLDRYCFDEMP